MTIYVYAPAGTVLAWNTQAAHDATDESVQHIWEPAPDGTLVGAVKHEDGSWENPALGPVVYPAILPGVFYACFTVQERIDIKAATDPMIQEFWATFQVAKETATPINPNTISVVEGLEYLTTVNVPGSTPTRKYLAASRIAEIQAGIVK